MAIFGNKMMPFGKIAQARNPIYDDATVIWSFRKFYNWNNAVLQLRRSSDNQFKTVFLDGDTITLNSKIGNGDDFENKTTTTLGDWIGSGNAYVQSWVGQNITNSLGFIMYYNTTSQQPQFISSGSIIVKNGKPAMYMLSVLTRLYLTFGISELAYNLNHTAITVSNNDVSGGTSAIFQTNATANARRYCLINDNSSNKYGTYIVSNATYQAKLINQENTANQKILTSVKNGSLFSLFYNNNFQNSVNIGVGDYVNDNFNSMER